MVKINKNQSVYETFVTNNPKVTQHRFQNSVWETSINGELKIPSREMQVIAGY